jgi:hypothetical protein
VDTVHQTRVVELLTKHSTAVFGPQELFDTRGGARPNRHSERSSDSDKLAADIRIGKH